MGIFGEVTRSSKLEANRYLLITSQYLELNILNIMDPFLFFLLASVLSRKTYLLLFLLFYSHTICISKDTVLRYANIEIKDTRTNDKLMHLDFSLTLWDIVPRPARDNRKSDYKEQSRDNEQLQSTYGIEPGIQDKRGRG